MSSYVATHRMNAYKELCVLFNSNFRQVSRKVDSKVISPLYVLDSSSSGSCCGRGRDMDHNSR